MKLAVLFLGTVFSLSSWAAPRKPAYDFTASEVYGTYEQQTTESCTERGRPCVAAVIKTIKGQPVIDLKDFGRDPIPLSETKRGNLVFKWENPEDDDCDDPGCSNLLGLSGVVYPKKVGSKFVPAVRVFAKWDYPFPDEEDAPEGNVVHVETYVKRSK